MTKSPAPRRLQRQAADLAEQQGNTDQHIAGTEPVQASTEPVQAEPLAEPDPIDTLKLEIIEAIASPETFTAAALADANQVSSATIRNRWASAIEQAISPYALRATDGKYTALAAWAFSDYRRTVAIEATTKAAWIEQVQALLPAAQLDLLPTDEQPEALAIVPWFSAGAIDVAGAETQADDLEAIVAEVIWESTAAESQADADERRKRLAQAARDEAQLFADEQRVRASVRSRLKAEARAAVGKPAAGSAA